MTEPVLAAPFVSSVMRLEPQWIDYNGHLNVAYYNVLFDCAVDEVYELLGLGPSYLERTKHSTMVVEVHVRYVRELKLDDPVRVAIQLIDYDAKRIHLFEELRHATENWISATSENMTLSVDMTTKKVAPFQDGVLRAPQIERSYRVVADRNSRAIAGLSMGGSESLMVGLNALDRFAWIGAFSTGGLNTNYPALFPNLNRETTRQLRLLWMGCGEQDGLLASNQRLSEWLTANGIHHTWVQTPGQHSFRVWRRYLADFAPLLFQDQRQK